MMYYVYMGLNQPNFMEELRHYPTDLQDRLISLGADVVIDRARQESSMPQSRDSSELTGLDLRESRYYADSASNTENYIEYLMKRHQRRERVRGVAEKFKGLLPFRLRKAELSLPIGPFEL